MQGTVLYQKLKGMAATDDRINKLLIVVTDIVEDSCHVARTIVRYMPEYTLHDEVHITRVVELMGRIIPSRVLGRLQPLEIAALLLAAALHDIGMAPSADEIQALSSQYAPRSYREEWLQYQAVKDTFPELLARQARLRLSARFSEAQEIEAFFLAEFIRKTHAHRAKKYIFEHYADKLIYDSRKFTSQLANVCYSHNEPASTLDLLPCWELVRAPGEYCNWRFVALVLRLADILDFDPKRTPRVLFEHIAVRNKVSIREWRKHLSISAWDIQPGRVAFSSQCPDPVIEKAIRDFVVLIDHELAEGRNVLRSMYDPAATDRLSDRYNLELPYQVDTRQVGPDQDVNGPLYVFMDLSFQLDQARIMSLLMGLSLYEHKGLFLRELLQNAADSCRHRQALHVKQPDLGIYHPKISVRLLSHQDGDFIEVEDNGMGMNEHIVRSFFSTVGRSYYQSTDFMKEKARLGLHFKPVSHFGIGILSCFMAGDQLDVETRRHNEIARPLRIEISGAGSLFWFRPCERELPGTRVRVRLTASVEELLPKGTSRLDSLRKWVYSLAPHLEILTMVETPEGRQKVSRKWDPPTLSSDEREGVKVVNIDLTDLGSKGLTGVIHAVLPWNGETFSDRVHLDDHDDPELCDYLSMGAGLVQRAHVDRSEKEGGIRTSYSTHVGARGKWSQQGFAVSARLMGSQQIFGRGAGLIRLPFPVLYDINLENDYILPLTADRERVSRTEESERVLEYIRRSILRAFLETLGREGLESSASFLVNQFGPNDMEVLQEIFGSFDLQVPAISREDEMRWSIRRAAFPKVTE